MPIRIIIIIYVTDVERASRTRTICYNTRRNISPPPTVWANPNNHHQASREQQDPRLITGGQQETVQVAGGAAGDLAGGWRTAGEQPGGCRATWGGRGGEGARAHLAPCGEKRFQIQVHYMWFALEIPKIKYINTWKYMRK